MPSYGQSGPAVQPLQRQLNTASSTHLPRLATDGVYGSLTMARVMEFQHQEKLGVDGNAGPVTLPRIAAKRPVTSNPAGRCILVDLINNRLRAFEDGKVRFDFRPIRGGSLTDPSTRGVFRVFKRLRHHTSSKFPEPPGNMDFSLFYNGPEAIHQGPPTEFSHGCVHVAPSQAEQLFNWAGQVEIMVIVLKLTR